LDRLSDREYYRHVHSSWLISTDSTSGGEMKSPIFSTTEDLHRQITTACQLLTAAQYTAPQQCGLHVHLGTGAKTNAEISRFHQFLYRNEDNFLRLVPLSRRDNGYCRLLTRDVLYNIGHMLTSEALAKTCWSTRPWFHFSNKDTTEVRLQLGSLDPDRIIDWVCFLQQCWRASQVDKRYDPQWRVLRMIDRTPTNIVRGFSTPAEGTKVAMRMVRAKNHDEIYRRARNYAYTHAAVS
jgi:hypothetical protein